MSDGGYGVPGAGGHLSREVGVGILGDILVINLAGGVVVEEGPGWVGGLTVRIKN